MEKGNSNSQLMLSAVKLEPAASRSTLHLTAMIMKDMFWLAKQQTTECAPFLFKVLFMHHCLSGLSQSKGDQGQCVPHQEMARLTAG